MKKFNLSFQLITITLISIIISFVSSIVILPKLLTPFYETNIYQMLEQPLQYINSDKPEITGKTAFIIVDSSGNVIGSNNLRKLLSNNDVNNIVKIINDNYGKFEINNRTYYYNTQKLSNEKIITLTDDTYIIEQRDSLNKVVFPIILTTSVITILILAIYSNFIVRKTKKIKEKIDNIDNSNYDHNSEFEINDEFNSLIKSIEKTRISLLEKETYKNNMFQTLSHELKTPITVILSHIEASKDKIITDEEALKVIKDETDKLSKQVSLILQLNKINYLKVNNTVKNNNVNVNPIIQNSILKFKTSRPDVKFKFDSKNKNIFKGTKENWEPIINNIMSNFIRFANNKIEITINDGTIEFYNDGDKISDDLIDQIFEPYKMGANGKHGLGLAIVKETVELVGYNITVKNQNKGVSFIIKETISK